MLVLDWYGLVLIKVLVGAGSQTQNSDTNTLKCLESIDLPPPAKSPSLVDSFFLLSFHFAISYIFSHLFQ